MSSAERNRFVEPGNMPTFDERKEFIRLRNWFRFLIALILFVWIILIVWVLGLAPITKAPVAQLDAANLTLALAPVLATAVAVERILEAIFNLIEGGWYNMVAYLGGRLSWLQSAEFEFKQARQFLADVTQKYNAEMKSMQSGQTSTSALAEEIARIEAANRIIALAQMRLADAESNLAEASSSGSYKRAKAAISILFAFTLGAFIAALGQLQMFAMLGLGIVPARIDVLVTGLAIASGAYIVHLLVGILEQGKDTLDSVKGYFNRSAPSVQSVTQRITTVQPPTTPSEPTIIEATTAKTTNEGSDDYLS